MGHWNRRLPRRARDGGSAIGQHAADMRRMAAMALPQGSRVSREWGYQPLDGNWMVSHEERASRFLGYHFAILPHVDRGAVILRHFASHLGCPP